jgi:hypothetical protein
MDRLRDQLLPCTRLTSDQNRRIRRCDASDETQDFLHLRGFGDDLGQVVLTSRDLSAESRIVFLKLMFFCGLIDQRGELRDSIRLCQVIVCAELHRFDRRLDRALTRQHYYLGWIRAPFTNAPKQTHAVETRHVDVA